MGAVAHKLASGLLRDEVYTKFCQSEFPCSCVEGKHAYPCIKILENKHPHRKADQKLLESITREFLSPTPDAHNRLFLVCLILSPRSLLLLTHQAFGSFSQGTFSAVRNFLLLVTSILFQLILQLKWFLSLPSFPLPPQTCSTAICSLYCTFNSLTQNIDKK